MKANEIGRVIKARLLASAEVTALVGQKIFPIVAVQSTPAPYVTYCRTSVKPGYTKDRKSLTDTATVEVTIYAPTYEQSIAVMNAVDNALQGFRGTLEDIEVDRVRLINSEEDFQDGAALQNLVFEIDINN